MITRIRAMGLVVAALVVAAFVGVNTIQADTATSGGVIIGPSSPSQNPVLNYDVTGGTLIGLIHLRLTVYETGLATISEAGFSVVDPPVDGECPEDGRADFKFVGFNEAKQLREDLKNAGAFDARNGGIAADVPLQTVTVFGKSRGGDQKAHTFTFYVASSQEILGTLEVIHAFLDKHFPEY